MEASNYKELLLEAIEDSVENRWKIFVANPDSEDAKGCSFCKLFSRVYGREDRKTLGFDCVCPLDRYDCGPEYADFVLNKTSLNAQAVLARIESIDVDAWIEKLVSLNLLEASDAGD